MAACMSINVNIDCHDKHGSATNILEGAAAPVAEHTYSAIMQPMFY
jgi:hypothetical protein